MDNCTVFFFFIYIYIFIYLCIYLYFLPIFFFFHISHAANYRMQKAYLCYNELLKKYTLIPFPERHSHQGAVILQAVNMRANISQKGDRQRYRKRFASDESSLLQTKYAARHCVGGIAVPSGNPAHFSGLSAFFFCCFLVVKKIPEWQLMNVFTHYYMLYGITQCSQALCALSCTIEHQCLLQKTMHAVTLCTS